MNQGKPDLRTVLVTRPAHQAGPLMTALKLRGYTPVAAPVLEMRATDMAIPQDDFDALAFTSANGVEAFAARDKRRDIPLFAVGPSTADAARKAHFEWIMAGNQGARALAEIIRERLAPGSRILHPAGHDVAVDLGEALDGSGIVVERVTLYEMTRVAALPDAALKAIAEGCVAPLYSARSAQAFIELAQQAGVSLGNVIAVLPLGENVPSSDLSLFRSATGPLLPGPDALADHLDRLEAVKPHL